MDMSSLVFIDKIKFHKNEIVCRLPSKKGSKTGWQKAHFRQGELDGACGAYSVAMLLNILGVFQAEMMQQPEKLDYRKRITKLVIELNRHGLYKDGLDRTEVKKIVNKCYGTILMAESTTARYSQERVIKYIADNIRSNNPAMMNLQWKTGGGHWVVVVGMECDENNNPNKFYTLDPGEEAPKNMEDFPFLKISSGASDFRHMYCVPEDNKGLKCCVFDAVSIKMRPKNK